MTSSVEKPRLTLKLRTPVSPARTAKAAPPPPAPQPTTFEPANKRPRADWSEVHKSAMQADMDRLARGGKDK